MRKSMIMVGVLFVLSIAVAATAYACDGNANCPIHGFFNSLGGFISNAMPWNWGNWAGK